MQRPVATISFIAFSSRGASSGGVICRQGEPGDAAYILLDGEADIVVTTAEGRQLTVAKIPKNTFIGEMAVLRNAPRNATVVAASPITALKVGKDAFYQLLRDVPQLAFEVMRELAERVEDTTAKLRDARAKLEAAGIA